MMDQKTDQSVIIAIHHKQKYIFNLYCFYYLIGTGILLLSKQCDFVFMHFPFLYSTEVSL